MTEQIATTLTQFGAAGLIGLLWLLERRHASHREQQIDEAHRRITSQSTHLNALLTVIKENTRAINTLQQGQQRLIGLLERLGKVSGTTGSEKSGSSRADQQ